MSERNDQDVNDPRVYLAAERTLLAWIRTGLSPEDSRLLAAPDP